MEKKHKEKVQEMIDEFEKINEKDHLEFEELERENERVKRQLKRCEILVEEKHREIEIVRENTISSEVEDVKRVCLN